MNRLFRQIVSAFVAGALLFGNSLQAYAQEPADICRNEGIVFGFFNGVQTTEASATVALQVLRQSYGTTLPSTGEAIRYEKFYNYTAGFEDFVETFEQRLLEQNQLLGGRFELFLEVMNGEGPWWSTIVNAIGAAAGILDGIVQSLQAQFLQSLTSLLGNPPTQINYAEHRLRIDNHAVEGKKMVFFAHSQGNLFVNPAADYARSKTSPGAVKVVHVAPASPTLRGQHVLADLDLVINGLRPFGSVPPITNIIPGYLLRPAGIGGGKDILGHGLLEIYLNPQLGISSSVRNLVTAALEGVTAPPQQATSGFFTATLTWNGSGDVDLHTFEPGGSHVYYGAPTGQAGFLDFDNVVANGPEHYYASCDPNKLQTGTYQVKVANYARATGRTATVQIASAKDGVLGTRSVVLGSPTGSNPVFSLFSVTVTKNAETGRYSVSVQ